MSLLAFVGEIAPTRHSKKRAFFNETTRRKRRLEPELGFLR